MPVEYRTGNLFDFEGNLAHGTNASGKMGKGIAVEFKKKFPSMYENYVETCKEGKHMIGMILPHNDIQVHSSFDRAAVQAEIAADPNFVNSTTALKTKIEFTICQKFIYNICIKPHWKMKAEPYAIWAGLRAMVKHLEANSNLDVKSPGFTVNPIEPVVALPQIGCGLGGLDWESQVKPIIEEIGSQTPCTLIVYLQEEATQKNESNIDPHDVNSPK